MLFQIETVAAPQLPLPESRLGTTIARGAVQRDSERRSLTHAASQLQSVCHKYETVLHIVKQEAQGGRDVHA
jgi:hypothetical protein